MKPGKTRSTVAVVAVAAVIMLAPLVMALAAAGLILAAAFLAAVRAWRKVTGQRPRQVVLVRVHRRPPLPPPGHPDWETSLSDDEKAALKRIEAALTEGGR